MRSLIVFAMLSFVAACQGEKAGDPCDKFFQNTCKAPMSCVDMGDNKVCAGSCDTDFSSPGIKKICKDPTMEPHEVSYTKGTTNIGSAGCYCLPKKK